MKKVTDTELYSVYVCGQSSEEDEDDEWGGEEVNSSAEISVNTSYLLLIRADCYGELDICSIYDDREEEGIKNPLLP